MIITAIVQFAVSIVSFMVGLIPSMKIEFSPHAQDSFYSVLSGVGAFMPVTHVGIILGLIILVYSGEFIWLLINWLIAKIPFIE